MYVADMLKRAKECDAADDMMRYAIVHGLRPELRAYVLQQGPTSTGGSARGSENRRSDNRGCTDSERRNS